MESELIFCGPPPAENYVILSGICALLVTFYLGFRAKPAFLFSAMVATALLPLLTGLFLFVSELRKAFEVVSSSEKLPTASEWVFAMADLLRTISVGVGFCLLCIFVSAIFLIRRATRPVETRVS